MNIILNEIQNDIDEFYKQSLLIGINKPYVEKKYLNTKRLLNIELENYKDKKNKYDPEIYKDENLLKKKLENELKSISGIFKNNINKNINNIKAQITEIDKLELILSDLKGLNLEKKPSAIINGNRVSFF